MGSLIQELKRRKVVRVAAVYTVVAWLLIQIAGEILPTFDAPAWVNQTIILVLFLGFPIAIVLAWAFEITPDGIKVDSDYQVPMPPSQPNDRKLIYAILALVLLVAGFQISDRVFVATGSREVISQHAANATAPQVNPRYKIDLGHLVAMSDGITADISISPDGSRIAYFSRLENNRWQINVREINQLEPKIIGEFTAEVTAPRPTFSPDGQWLVYYNKGDVEKLSIHGGAPITVTAGDAVISGALGLFWGDDDSIYYAGSELKVRKVSSMGGESELMPVSVDGGLGFMSSSIVLPNRDAILLTTGTVAEPTLALQMIDSGTLQLLSITGMYPQYANTGHIVFIRDQELWGVPFDVDTLSITGDLHQSSTWDIHQVSLTGALTGAFESRPLILGRSAEAWGEVSPNDNSIVYMSDQTDRGEVYLRSYPNTSSNVQPVSTNGGTFPRWNNAGTEIYYLNREEDSTNVKIMAVGVQSEPALVVDTPRLLFSGNYFAGIRYPPFDVTGDGERFLMLKNVGQTDASVGDSELERTHLVVLENWFEELKRLAPPDPR